MLYLNLTLWLRPLTAGCASRVFLFYFGFFALLQFSIFSGVFYNHDPGSCGTYHCKGGGNGRGGSLLIVLHGAVYKRNLGCRRDVAVNPAPRERY